MQYFCSNFADMQICNIPGESRLTASLILLIDVVRLKSQALHLLLPACALSRYLQLQRNGSRNFCSRGRVNPAITGRTQELRRRTRCGSFELNAVSRFIALVAPLTSRVTLGRMILVPSILSTQLLNVTRCGSQLHAYLGHRLSAAQPSPWSPSEHFVPPLCS